MKVAFVAIAMVLGVGYGAWQIETVEDGIEPTVFNPTSIALSDGNTPAIAYSSRPDVETNMSITYARRPSSTWNAEIVLREYLESSVADLCFDYAGEPYIGAWHVGPFGLVFLHKTGSAWIVDTMIDNSSVQAAAFQLLPPQYLTFAYCRSDSTGQQLYYALWDTGGWFVEPALPKLAAVRAIDLAHAGPEPYVSFIGQYQGIVRGLMCANRSSGFWTAETIAGVEADAAGRTGIIVDPEGIPHIFCYGYLASENNNGIIYSYKTGSGWRSKLVDSLAASRQNCPVGACIDGRGRFHLVYTSKRWADQTISLCYAYGNGADWQTEKIVTSSDTSAETFCGASIAVDSEARAHVAFRRMEPLRGRAEIRYARRDEPVAESHNPANPDARASIVVPGITHGSFPVRIGAIPGPVSIALFDRTGRQVSRIHIERPGSRVTLPGRALGAGVYFIVVESAGLKFLKKTVLVR